MGATNTTTYYNLSQFIGTDKPAWLQDYNGDMLKIDTAINNAKVAADSAANAASAAQNDATTALGDITTINGQIGTINTTLGTAVGNINTINSLIGNGTPTTTDQTIIGAINELHNDISSAPSVLASVTADGVKTYSQLLSELHSALTTYLTTIGDNQKVHLIGTRGTGGAISEITLIYGKNGNIGSRYFKVSYCSATHIFEHCVRFGPTSSDCHWIESDLAVGGTVTVTAHDTDVPTSGDIISAIGYVL